MTDETRERREWILSALDRHEGPLIRYAVRLTGDVDRARDVVQETFLRLCSQPRSEVEGRVAEWLFTVCRNKALDVKRKEQPMTEMSEEQAAVRTSPEPGPTAAIEQEDTLSKVLQVMNGLPDNQREVLRLKFQQGLSYKEISRVTELTVGNVGYLIHVGLKSLKEKLAGGALQESVEGSN